MTWPACPIEDVEPQPGVVHGRVVFGRRGSQEGVVIPGMSDGLATLGPAGSPASVAPPPTQFSGFRVHHVAHRRALGQVGSAPSGVPVVARVSVTDLAADLVAYLDAEVVGPVILAGHSLGAMLALHVAARRPQRVAALILSAPALAADAALVAGLDRWDRALVAGDPVAYRRAAIEDAYTGTVRRDALASLELDVVAKAGRAESVPPAALARHLALSGAARSHDLRGQLGSVVAPALVVAGGEDHLVTPAAARAVATELATAQFEVIDGVAHGFAEQAPAHFADLVATFLDRLRLL